jgi:hypothetical protein
LTQRDFLAAQQVVAQVVAVAVACQVLEVQEQLLLVLADQERKARTAAEAFWVAYSMAQDNKHRVIQELVKIYLEEKLLAVDLRH